MADLQTQIRQGIQKAQQQAGYGVSMTSYHTHDNINSPKFPFTNLSDVPDNYSGAAGKSVVVNSGGTGLIFASPGGAFGGTVNANGTAGTPFPSGWSVAHTGTGAYTVTHNLGTTNYVVVITLNGSLTVSVVNLQSKLNNSFKFTWYNQTSSISWSAADTASDFILLPQS